MPDEEILVRLLALNLERSCGHGGGVIHTASMARAGEGGA